MSRITFNLSLCCIIAACLASAGPASAAAKKLAKTLPDAKQTVTLGAVDGESDDKMSVVTIRLSAKTSWSSVPESEDHGSFVQVRLPNIFVPTPGQFFDGNSPHIKKIATFQISAKDAGIRLFVNSRAATIRKAMSAELLGNRVVITVDHKSLSKLLAADTEGVATAATVATAAVGNGKSGADVVIAKTTVDKDIPAPAGLIKSKDSSELNVGGGGPDLRGRMVGVAVFSGIMLICLILLYFLKPYLSKRSARSGSGETITMRTLATLPLAAKQKLSLVEVGNEKILIGVTPENVSFITAIGKHEILTPQLKRLPQAGPANTRMAPASQASPVDLHPSPLRRMSRTPEPVKTRPTAGTPATNAKPERSESPLKKKANDCAKVAGKTKKRAGASGDIGKRINVSVGDDGIESLETPTTSTAGRQDDRDDSQRTIDDVTRLIREKLKNLPPI